MHTHYDKQCSDGTWQTISNGYGGIQYGISRLVEGSVPVTALSKRQSPMVLLVSRSVHINHCIEKHDDINLNT